MKTFEEINVPEFLVNTGLRFNDFSALKSGSILRNYIEGNDSRVTTLVNLVLSNSETPEEIFTHIFRIHMMMIRASKQSTNLTASLLVFPKELADKNDENNPLGYIKEEEVPEIVTSMNYLLNDEGPLPYYLTVYQKNLPNPTWKGAAYIYAQLLSSVEDSKFE